jgi:hypothetical protein
MTTETIDRKALIAQHGLTITSTFVPWDKSRNKNEKQPSLNWTVTLQHKGRPIWEGDYMAGMAHAPAYAKAQSSRQKVWDDCVRLECLVGKPCRPMWQDAGAHVLSGKPMIQPDLESVIYSLLSDASALDEGSFEEWASSLGYDTDSRRAEDTYRACIAIGVALRAAIGDAGLSELREAFQDY